jgi:hypoxanthine phosphoribosyltransferase
MTEMQQKILFTEEAIHQKVQEIAAAISQRYPEGEIVLVGILKGAFVFTADLARAIDRPCRIDFVRISSYGSGTESSGKLNITLDVTLDIADKHVILVDDIVDTGLTIADYKKVLEQRGPKTLEICALIDKTGRREKAVDIDYAGFQIEDGFVVGYGLDCDEQYRNLRCVAVLE